jgi:RHS repeat-associated protein
LSGAAPKTFGYGYDPAGNRTNETINAAAAPVTVNALNQLVSRTGANPRAFAYDANGNMVSNNGVGRTATNYTYQWDAENRLVAILYPTTNQRTEFAYDGLGRRIRITERTGATTNSVREFVWDGLSIAEERDGAGNLVKRFYSQGQMNGGIPLFYSRDHLGSVREVANTTGVLQSRYDYDPYGRRTLTAGPDVADFGFTGHFYHVQSKLHLAPYRGYDPDVARWVNRDPIGENGGMNLYGYANDDPINGLDRWGLICEVVVKRIQPDVTLSGFRPGHQWIEYPGGSVGFRPAQGEEVSLSKPSCVGETSRPERYATTYMRKKVDVTWQTVKSNSGVLASGPSQGKKCCEATCSDIIACLSVASVTRGRYDFFSNNCRNGTDSLLSQCCLTTNGAQVDFRR